MSKSNLDVMECHPRYLQLSLGCKQYISKFPEIFGHFCAFLQLKLLQPKNCKNPKKSIFFKKWSFSKNALNMIIWSNIAGKWPQRCLKTFFMYIWHLEYISCIISKIERKIDFEKIFLMHASTNLAEIHFCGRISAKYCRGPKIYHLAPSRKKSLPITRRFLIPAWFCILMSWFGENPYFHI